MAAVVSLSNLVGELQILTDEQRAFLNTTTGEIILALNDHLDLVESGEEDFDDYPEWERTALLEAEKIFSSADFVELPGKFEIHEYEIMERFCLSVENERIRHELLARIRGSGAFRRFRETITRHGVENDWYRFKDEAFKEIAIDWLDRHAIAYVDDLRPI